MTFNKKNSKENQKQPNHVGKKFHLSHLWKKNFHLSHLWKILSSQIYFISSKQHAFIFPRAILISLSTDNASIQYQSSQSTDGHAAKEACELGKSFGREFLEFF